MDIFIFSPFFILRHMELDSFEFDIDVFAGLQVPAMADYYNMDFIRLHGQGHNTIPQDARRVKENTP